MSLTVKHKNYEIKKNQTTPTESRIRGHLVEVH